ncbi:MAG: DUF3500 domain-containing protein [Acidobacteriia bacterium]|nr:DUF3500 domain-containing protein [Terriglobia bacterium]
MRRTVFFRAAALTLGVGLAAIAYHATTEDLMVSSANAWLASLNSNQVTTAQFKLDNPDYERWHYVPDNSFTTQRGYGRNGLTYRDMSPEQRSLADALLAASLSRAGFVSVKTIMSLEEVLRIQENDNTGRRDVDVYHVSIFGKPSMNGRWAWRMEGHHVSLHFLMQDGKLVSTAPEFLGANPHMVLDGPRKGVRPLGAREDTARELMMSLGDSLKKKALVAEKAYRDILTTADSRAELENEPQGLAASELSQEQYEMLLATADQYAVSLPAEQAEARMKRVRGTPKEQLFFAWAGSIEPGGGDYYRIQSPEFLIEYDNVQNGNNHSHTVWREFKGDFGRDLLAAHYRLDDHGMDLNRSVAAD